MTHIRLTPEEDVALLEDYKIHGFTTRKAMVIHALELYHNTRHNPENEKLAIVENPGMTVRRII